MHQALFCPPTQTLLCAINLGFLPNFPYLDNTTIHKFLIPSAATAKGHIKRTRAGVHSTTVRPRTHLPNTPLPHIPCESNIFCYAALADKQMGTFYTDCTGALPAGSIDGHHYFFVAYDYDTNYIFAIPIPATTDAAILDAFKQVYTTLTNNSYTPTLHVTDNQANAPIKQFLTTNNCKIQLVEPYNHHVNAAERAIQTFKNHFISGLCITDKNFPSQLWSHLAQHATITCNLLRCSRI